jgi:hypothetical protein
MKRFLPGMYLPTVEVKTFAELAELVATTTVDEGNGAVVTCRATLEEGTDAGIAADMLGTLATVDGATIAE